MYFQNLEFPRSFKDSSVLLAILSIFFVSQAKMGFFFASQAKMLPCEFFSLFICRYNQFVVSILQPLMCLLTNPCIHFKIGVQKPKKITNTQ